MMKMIPKPPMIRVVAMIGALVLVPLQVPFGDEVPRSSGVYECRISGVKVFNEAVSVACGMDTWYG
jgi:hypothetical protein